ncbi:MAG: hypothetical protein OJF49_002352 [Ktedonobacterales bacterium]|nr:MAG: hypothetical protein OJF49_002352 [Ktedonobacterales bacterium]
MVFLKHTCCQEGEGHSSPAQKTGAFSPVFVTVIPSVGASGGRPHFLHRRTPSRSARTAGGANTAVCPRSAALTDNLSVLSLMPAI